MTRSRMFGSDAPFCEWMRSCKELPSYSSDLGFVATDIDIFVHRYLMSVDSEGTRDIQAMMLVEVKTRGGCPSESQLDTLSKVHAFSRKSNGSIKPKSVNEQEIHWFGAYVLRLSGTSPKDSKWMMWCRLINHEQGRALTQTRIDIQQLIKLLSFQIHPDTLIRLPFRRHHKTSDIVLVETTPLGFDVEKHVVRKS